MTEIEEARAAIARSRQTREHVKQLGAGVDRVMGSLNFELEQNGFSTRIARLFDLEDPRK